MPHVLPAPHPSRRLLATATAALLACAGAAAHGTAPARATIAPAAALDGPSAAILDVDGAAMAPDGSGGIVYRKLDGGQPHVFVVRFLNGRWSRPIRVDAGAGQPATQPAIAAGAGGRLLVAWVAPWAVLRDGKVHYQLLSAAIEPGARGFARTIEVDKADVGDGSAAFPRLAMAANGSAYVAYRVVANALSKDQPSTGIQPMRPGDELVDVRVARFNGTTWSGLPTINRLPGQVTIRRPSQDNAPAIAVAPSGDGLVVWQEPGIDGVARLWARRLFGTAVGVVLPVSPDTLGGAPITVDADAPAIAFSQFSEAKVAFRVAGGAGSPLRVPHVFVNELPSSLDEQGAGFAGPSDVDGAAVLGVPSVAIDDVGDVRLAYAAAGAARLATGDSDQLEPPSTLAPTTGSSVLTTVDPDGGGVAAWLATDGAGRPVVAARQEFPSGQWQLAQLSAPLSGPIDGLSAGQSGLGDALVAFRQGSGDRAQVAAAIAKAPPGRFNVQAPSDWVRIGPRGVVVRWDPAPNAIGRVSYAVYVDGVRRCKALRRRAWRIPARGLGDGGHAVQVLAADGAGQQTMSATATLQADPSPPRATVRPLRGRRLRVVVRDRASGLDRAATRISFGDGSRTVRGGAGATHRYARPGRFRVTVRVRDRVGNAATWRLRAQVR